MTVLTTVSAVTFDGDGKQQIFKFEASGERIPHESADEVIVRVNGDVLDVGLDYAIAFEPQATVVTLLKPPPRGAEIELERHTPLLQPKQFRKDSDWNLDTVEGCFDRLTRAAQDALWRIARIEKIVRVEHRTVEIPAGPIEVGVDAVKGLPEALAAIVSERTQVAANPDQMAEIVVHAVLEELLKPLSELSERVSRIESRLAALYQAAA